MRVRLAMLTAVLVAAGMGSRIVFAAQGPPEGKALDLEILWRRPLGSGHSGVAVTKEGRLLTLFSDGASDWLISLDADSGRELWRYRIAATYRGHDGSRDGPHATPVEDGERVYGLGPRGHLFAVQATSGSELWSIDLPAELGAAAPYWGFASTPVLAGDILVVAVGGGGGRAFCGFARRTGEVIWCQGDDRIGYQSPQRMTLAARDLIVAPGDREVLGIDPAEGELLWRLQYSSGDEEGSARPVAVGRDTFLLTSSVSDFGSQGTAYRVTGDGSAAAVEKLWESRAFKRSYALPVKVGDYLYGFSGGFLTCAELATGRERWRSREPGAGDLALAGDRLVIFAEGGLLVVAGASADRYTELARAKVLRRGSLTAPTVDGTRVFVRNHEEIAGVRIVGRASGSSAPRSTSLGRPAQGLLRSWVLAVEGAEPEERSERISDFLAAHPGSPVLENDRWAHFVYRGPGMDVSVLGSMTGYYEGELLERIPGTDVFYRTYALPDGRRGGRWEYLMRIDEGSWGVDPRNSEVAHDAYGEVSEVRLPGWREPSHLRDPGGPSGSIETMRVRSEILGNERDVAVYLPSGYPDGDRGPYPLLVVLDGPRVRRLAQLPRALDNLLGAAVRPTVVAFVDPAPPSEDPGPSRVAERAHEYGGRRTALHGDMLAEELVPLLASRYRLAATPEQTAVLGFGSPGLAALHAALSHPTTFGRVAAVSVRFGPTELQTSALLARPTAETLFSLIRSPLERKPVVILQWFESELMSEEEDIDVRRDNRELARLLRESGYEVGGGELPGGVGWASFAATLDGVLRSLFGMP